MLKGHSSIIRGTSVMEKLTPGRLALRRAAMGGANCWRKVDEAEEPIVEYLPAAKAVQSLLLRVLLALGPSGMTTIG